MITSYEPADSLSDLNQKSWHSVAVKSLRRSGTYEWDWGISSAEVAILRRMIADDKVVVHHLPQQDDIILVARLRRRD